MICTRCGTVQRRETAKFCHLCGALIEPAAADVQPDSAEIPTIESAPQLAQTFKPIALLPHEPDAGDAAPTQLEERRQPELSGFVADRQDQRERYADENTLKTPSVASPGHAVLEVDQPPHQPAVAYPGWEEPSAPVRDQQALRQGPAQATRVSHPQPSIWSQERSLAEEQQEEASDAWKVGRAASEDGIPREQPHHRSAGEYYLPEKRSSPLRDRSFPTPQNRRISSARTSLEVPDEAPVASAERPIRSSARGPVPGAFSQPRRIKRRRLPLGIAITLGLLLVFVLAGFGLYEVVSGSGIQEPSAFQPYTDPGHHFSIQYPNVWTIKKPTNGASGARFTDATDTAELWVTYMPSTPNLTSAQFADQEAINAGIATPASDMDTFAGATWVVRSGIVTLTSGISQQILLYVTLHNNLFFEVRKVAPLDSYNEPNQMVFMPMLQSLTLM